MLYWFKKPGPSQLYTNRPENVPHPLNSDDRKRTDSNLLSSITLCINCFREDDSQRNDQQQPSHDPRVDANPIDNQPNKQQEVKDRDESESTNEENTTNLCSCFIKNNESKLAKIKDRTTFKDFRTNATKIQTLTLHYERKEYIFERKDFDQIYSNGSIKKGGFGQVFNITKESVDRSEMNTQFKIKIAKRFSQKSGSNNGLEILILQNLSKIDSMTSRLANIAKVLWQFLAHFQKIEEILAQF